MAVRPLAREEDGAAAALFARSFSDDPFALHVGPRHVGLRHRLLARQYLREIEALRRAGGLLSCVGADGGDGGRVALSGVLTADRWTADRPSSRWLPWPSSVELTMVGGGPAVLRRCIAGERCLSRARPTDPHIYVVKVAVAAEHRGTGVGRTLMDHVLGQADRQRLPTLLDTMRAETVAYYERFGFRTTRRLRFSDDLQAWLMTRPSPAGAPDQTGRCA